MNTFAIVSFALALAAVNAGIIADHDVVLQGPSSKTTLVGPDGSHISGHAPGGQVVHSVDVGYAAHTGHVHAAPIVAPVVAHSVPVVSHVAHVAPIVAHAAPIVAHAAPIFAHAAPIVAHAAPIVAHGVPAVAHSSFSRVDNIASTGFVSHVAPVVVGHANVGHDLVGSGHEGQYVHDYTEALYDDGSYKAGHYDEHHDYDHHY